MSKILESYLKLELDNLKKQGFYNHIDVLEGANGPLIKIAGKTLINLSANNYLGLLNDPRLKKAAQEAIQVYGTGAGAVRTINGTLKIHEELEAKIAAFKGTEAAIVFQSGYSANLGTLPAILSKKDAVISDSLNHASIIDGIRLSKATVFKVNHQDMNHLREVAAQARASQKFEKIVYISDGVFSMDGDLVNLPEVIKIAREYQLITYIDDAHGSGVMGHGKGTVKAFNLSKEVDIQMGTLSKAIGVIGGYVAGSQILIDFLKLRARTFLFSTSLSPASAAAALQAFKILENEPERYQKLWANANFLKSELKALGFQIGDSQTPITPCIIGDENLSKEFSKALFAAGIYAKAIVYPTVAKNQGRVRNLVSAQHDLKMLQKVVSAYARLGRQFNLIK